MRTNKIIPQKAIAPLRVLVSAMVDWGSMRYEGLELTDWMREGLFV